MNSSKIIYPVCIVGGGSAGTMAVLRSVLNNDLTLFFEGTPKHKKASRAFWVSKVENMPAHLTYLKGIEDPKKETLEWIFQSPFSHNLVYKKNVGVSHIEKKTFNDGKVVFEVTDTQGETYLTHHVVLCTGVMDVQPNIGGSIKPILPYANVQLADYCLRCDGHHTLGKKVGVLGHTMGALWVLIMLHERYQTKGNFLFTNGEHFIPDDDGKKFIEKYSITIVAEKLDSIRGNAKEKTLEGFLVGDKQHFIPVDMVFISLGMIVYNDLAKSLGVNLDERGFVLTNSKGETNVEGFYVAGDLRANAKKQIYTAWDHAVDALDDINMKIRKMKRNQI